MPRDSGRHDKRIGLVPAVQEGRQHWNFANVSVFPAAGQRSQMQPTLYTQRLPIQAKLSIGAVNDPLEYEADRVAEHVMRSPPVSGVSVAAAFPQISRKCEACEEEEKIQREPAGPEPATTEAPNIVHEVLRSPGEPLDPPSRIFMEPRFGRDLSRVRVHNCEAAWKSAREMNALAYTVGHHIIFGAGQLAPGTEVGRRLLAHELTHVVQQTGVPRSRFQPGGEYSAAHPDFHSIQTAIRPGPDFMAPGPPRPGGSISNYLTSGPLLQRACGPAQIGSHANCIGRGGDITDFGGDSGKMFQFRVNCDELLLGEVERVKKLVKGLDGTVPMHIDGFSSEEGPADFNEELSCARAKALKSALFDAGVAGNRISVLYKHGATPGDRPFHRSAVVSIDWTPSPEPTENCSKYVGTCEFYLCRERQGHCGDKGYYKSYGYKYCERFTHLARRLSDPGKDWVHRTLQCLQEHIDTNIPVDTPCPAVKRSAYDSHPGCYVRSGVCFLDPSEMGMIVDTVDIQDLELRQVLITGVDCFGNWAPLGLFPQLGLSLGGGYQGLMERDRQRTRRLMQPPPVGR